MGINLGDVVPDFEAKTSMGEMKFHEYIDGSWAMLVSHPADYTPVCTTELGTLATYEEQLSARGFKLAALSCNDVDSHKGWIADIESAQWAKGKKVNYPIIADPNREIATTFGMLDPVAKDAAGLPMTCRAVFIIGPDKKLKLSLLYPASTGRNFNEIIRVIDSLQLTANHSVATPANWTDGDSCMVLPTISNEDAEKKFPKGFKTIEVPSQKGYLRMTPQPNK
mmetsp:Transcript_2251/g.8046  ORF Transcript_2251/g.8046 Transcript_2251/m.8046 type:complete len:224 (-) Transcript_2251:124-795(-)